MRVVDAAEQYLASTGRYFQRGGAIVTVRIDPASGAASVRALDQSALLYALDGAAWTKLDKRRAEWVQIDAPERHCKTLLAGADYAHLPVLKGVARQPYLHADGTLQCEPGYDAATGMYGAFRAGGFPVPATPTKQDASKAMMVLQDLLNEFEFATEADRSAALSAMLTAAVRPSLDQAPMYHVRAPQISSGKSFLCGLIATFATADQSSPVGFPSSDQECAKLLSSELMRAPAVIEFDNLTTDLLAHKSLCTALTSEHMTARILGVSKTLIVNTRTLFLSSGNNVGPVKDMTRRVLTINLDPACEIPAAKSYSRPDLLAVVRGDRERYVTAALTVVRAWIVAGKPIAPCKALAGYGSWSELCRQPLLWLGLPDPAQAIFDGLANDPDREVLGRLMAAWQAQFGSDGTMVKDVVKRIGEMRPGVEDLSDAIIDTGNRLPVNRLSLGWWLKGHAGQIVDGRKLVKATKKRNADAWHVMSGSSDVSVSAAPEAEIGIAMPTETVESC